MNDQRLAQCMTAELASLLDAVPAARRALPHLAVVEQRLRSEGLDCLGELPLGVLEKAGAQLKNLPLTPQQVLLPQLQSLLGLVIEARLHPVPKGSADHFLSSFMTDDKLSVSDASHTDFARVFEAVHGAEVKPG